MPQRITFAALAAGTRLAVDAWHKDRSVLYRGLSPGRVQIVPAVAPRAVAIVVTVRY